MLNTAIWLLYVVIAVLCLRAACRRERLTWGVSWAGLGLAVLASLAAFVADMFGLHFQTLNEDEWVSCIGYLYSDMLYLLFLSLFLCPLFWRKKHTGALDWLIFLGILLPLGRILTLCWFGFFVFIGMFYSALQHRP